MVAEDVAGRKVKCPRCATVFDAPQSADGSVSADKTLPPSAAGVPLIRTPSTTNDIHPELVSFLSPPQEPGEIGRLGPYRIVKVLGVGGMGVVFEAEDVQLQRPVALKAMLPRLRHDPACRQRFMQEARSAAAAGAIGNDHIVAVYQVGEANGVPFIATQLLLGESLENRLQRVKRLPMDSVLPIGREIADGLDAAHARQLVHRDIKPSNIWLEAGRDRVKILDFGLARSVGGSHLTKSGVLIGTPSYMAPEQARGGQAVGPRSDLFSLGCVLYRLCTGELPFKGNDTLATLTALATVEPPRVDKLNPAVPRSLADLIARLLAKDPVGRPPSARAVVEALEAISKSALKAIPPPSPDSPGIELIEVGDTVALELLDQDRREAKRRWVLGIIRDIVVLVLVVTGILLLLHAVTRSADTAPPPQQRSAAPSAKAKREGFFAALEIGIREGRARRSKLVGGGFANREYEDIPQEGALLIGFEVGLSKFAANDCVGYVRPIFLTEQGEKQGRPQGTPDRVKTLKAKNGYVVAGLKVRGGGVMDRLSIVFMRRDGNRLDRDDAYESDAVGGMGGSEAVLEADGSLVIGIVGKALDDGNVGQLGLVTLSPE
jgi:serine/threonine protein kinase